MWCTQFLTFYWVRGHFEVTRGPPQLMWDPLRSSLTTNVSKNECTASLALITKSYHVNFGVNRMIIKGARAASIKKKAAPLPAVGQYVYTINMYNYNWNAITG